MFEPKHAHPFTPLEALALDPPTITGEISRLQNSLAHLRSSNDALREFLAEEGADDELERSVKENEETIAAQEERILLLRACLAQKLGLDADHHYSGSAPNTQAPSGGARILPEEAVQFIPATQTSVSHGGVGRGPPSGASADATSPPPPSTTTAPAPPSSSPAPVESDDPDDGVHL